MSKPLKGVLPHRVCTLGIPGYLPEYGRNRLLFRVHQGISCTTAVSAPFNCFGVAGSPPCLVGTYAAALDGPVCQSPCHEASARI